MRDGLQRGLTLMGEGQMGEDSTQGSNKPSSWGKIRLVSLSFINFLETIRGAKDKKKERGGRPLVTKSGSFKVDLVTKCRRNL